MDSGRQDLAGRARSTCRRRPTTKALVEKIAAERGLNFDAVSVKPTGEALKLKPVRIALWDRYGGSMDSGWIRWIFEQAYPITFELVFAPKLDAGDLNAKYDVIIFPNGSIPALAGDAGGRRGGGGFGQGPNPADVPEEFRGWIGNITAEKTIPQLKKFVENGGTIIAIGSGTSIAGHFGLPVVEPPERAAAERRRAAPGQREVLRARAPSSTSPWTTPTRSLTAWATRADVFFDNSPVFRLDARRGDEGREDGRVVRLPDAAAQRLGVGPELPG